MPQNTPASDLRPTTPAASDGEPTTTIRITEKNREFIRALAAEKGVTLDEIVSGLIGFYQSRTQHQHLLHANDLLVELAALESGLFGLNEISGQVVEAARHLTHLKECRLLQAADHLLANPPAHLKRRSGE